VTRAGNYLLKSRGTCAAHIIYCHASAFIDHGKGVLQGSIQQPDYNNSDLTFNGRNDLVLFIL